KKGTAQYLSPQAKWPKKNATCSKPMAPTSSSQKPRWPQIPRTRTTGSPTSWKKPSTAHISQTSSSTLQHQNPTTKRPDQKFGKTPQAPSHTWSLVPEPVEP